MVVCVGMALHRGLVCHDTLCGAMSKVEDWAGEENFAERLRQTIFVSVDNVGSVVSVAPLWNALRRGRYLGTRQCMRTV